MTYVDAHIHLSDPRYAGQTEAIVEEGRKAGVGRILSNSVDYPNSVATISLAERHRGTVLPAIGVHPWTVVDTTTKPDVSQFERLIENERKSIAAIGEIGLDWHYTQDEEKKIAQKELFQAFLTLAEKNGLPVVIHSRLAIDDVLETLTSFSIAGVLLHWYSGPVEKLSSILERGYLISIGPSVLYSKKTIEIARHSDLGIMLSETDGPVQYYGPFKSRVTGPSFIPEVVGKLAEIKHVDVETIRDTIWQNFARFLGSNKMDVSRPQA